MAITFKAKHITIDGKRVGVSYFTGPWIAGVDPTTIKVRPRRATFPAAVRAHVAIENNSDAMTDYFEADCIRITAAHPLYAEISAAAASAK